MSELVFFRRGEEVLRVALERQRLVLGRAEDNDIVIPDPHVSRQHVALLLDGSRCLLEDLSGHGTLVAGQPLHRGELPDGADLRLGQWSAVFRERGTTGAAGPTRTGHRTGILARQSLEDAHRPVQLRVKHGTTERLYVPGPGSFTVGKDPDNDLVLQDRFISGQHLQVTPCEAGFHVRDLNSTNGTFVDTVRLFEAELPLYSVLRLGETELRFEPRSPRQPQDSFHGIVGAEPSVRHMVELIQRLAPSPTLVTVLGESGTGKELVARALHACSPRAQQPFIPINCAALSPSLMESELFGHEKGAFTGADSKRKGAFEEAHGGTLFLDEVGELPLELQAKLLRVLENGEVKPVGSNRPFHVDVRVVAATNRDLLLWARNGRFREDLFYRLSLMPLVLPPLRSRRRDIPALAEHFVRTYAPQGHAPRFTAAALARLQQHSWPGNIRELRNVVCRALLVRQGPHLDSYDITFEQELHRAPEDAGPPPLELPEGVSLDEMIQRLERQLIESTLRRCHYRRDLAAKELGLARSSLFKRLKLWGLGSEDA
ncbi:sigma 54-interacting transcriptional regulator [Hyalangium versicolor]|uniref:sigma 54-interacting transcriptional regulator n=1 Tax=Hyalangium versicolor TaxID=2861190 RepID=UPI001CCBFFD1|nr:sigma 54-interacting transcriptional regulator [Hyalangium versicolor]